MRSSRRCTVVGFLRSGSLSDVPRDRVTAFREGLKEVGFVEGQNVAIEYRSDEYQTDRLPLLVADLLSRQVALIVGDTPSALAAKAATTTVPIIFVTGGDPVKIGLAASLNRPGGNDVEGFDLLPHGRSRSSDVWDKLLGSGEFGIDEHGNAMVTNFLPW
jgi:hypothetical protein